MSSAATSDRASARTASFLGAGGHTKGADDLVGVVMEAMRAERRGVDMEGWTGGFGFYQGDMWLQFFYKKKKTGYPFFLFLFSSCVSSYFLLRRGICLWHLFFRACHDASLAKREVAIAFLGGTAVV